MKKIGLILFALVLALAVPTAVFSWDSHYSPNDLSTGVQVGFYPYGLGIYLAAYPFAEWDIYQTKIANVLPIDIGVAAKGRIAVDAGAFGSGIAAGAGGFVTLHIGFRNLDVGPLQTYLDPIDLEWGLGPVFDFLNPLYTGGAGFGFASYEGINYFINPNFAVFLGNNYWRYEWDWTIGVRFKTGK